MYRPYSPSDILRMRRNPKKARRKESAAEPALPSPRVVGEAIGRLVNHRVPIPVSVHILSFSGRHHSLTF